ncbi:hypothetical protein [Arthrobacter sp.]|uniref:hypothetical protein n=1 Tax=Arthrobacter sp. TaxID=1667 RepID=UPI00289D8D01|nr:hypothetical protein [Arthrobacter sp.]
MDESNENPDAEAPAGTETSRKGAPVRVPGPGTVTGDTGVDAVLSGLDRVPELPVSEHAALYTDLHDGLLAALNQEPGAE